MVEDKPGQDKTKSSGRSGSPARRQSRAPAAARGDELREKHRKRARDKRWAIGLVSAGAVVGVQHWLEHLSVIGWPFDPALQDLTIGYATAGVLIIFGLIKLPA